MKISNFKWSYNSENGLRPDRSMSRAGLSSLVRSWRKNGHRVSRTVSDGKTLFIVQVGDLVAFAEVS